MLLNSLPVSRSEPNIPTR